MGDDTAPFDCIVLFLVGVALATRLGAVFIPKLDEGAIAGQATRFPSVSLETTVQMTTQIEKCLLKFPEVETVVRSLRPAIVGRRILNAEFGQLRVLIGSPHKTAEALAGRRIKSIERHGKFIAIRLDRGYLVVHLGMTGQLTVVPTREPTPSHTHLVMDLDDGDSQLRFRDIRRFGSATR